MRVRAEFARHRGVFASCHGAVTAASVSVVWGKAAETVGPEYKPEYWTARLSAPEAKALQCLVSNHYRVLQKSYVHSVRPGEYRMNVGELQRQCNVSSEMLQDSLQRLGRLGYVVLKGRHFTSRPDAVAEVSRFFCDLGISDIDACLPSRMLVHRWLTRSQTYNSCARQAAIRRTGPVYGHHRESACPSC